MNATEYLLASLSRNCRCWDCNELLDQPYVDEDGYNYCTHCSDNYTNLVPNRALVPLVRFCNTNQIISTSQIPWESFFCPVSRQFMVNPAVDSFGFSYEEGVINEFVELNCFCPLNLSPMTVLDLAPNISLRTIITELLSYEFFQTQEAQEALANLQLLGNEEWTNLLGAQ